ncbi:hypothetical protein [Microcoleus sp. CAWBG58]|uniref:hypothetical protein n=1 Tax=Microcoleus sp. CAWBG58 TaxID=2841651 RepID=UPI0025FCA629|nr:hypothetical protein [Microcoleus sp. CAWBG58]
MKSSTKYLTGKSTRATMRLVDGLVNPVNHTGMVEGAKYPDKTLDIAPLTLEERSALGVKTLVRSKLRRNR